MKKGCIQRRRARRNKWLNTVRLHETPFVLEQLPSIFSWADDAPPNPPSTFFKVDQKRRYVYKGSCTIEFFDPPVPEKRSAAVESKFPRSAESKHSTSRLKQEQSSPC